MDAAARRLERAKAAASALTTDKRRQWLTATVRNYSDDSYPTTLHVLEGTPPRGYILENAQRGICTVLDAEGRLFGDARYGDYEPVRWFPNKKKG